MIIAANWKMNLNLQQSINLIDGIIPITSPNTVLVFPSNINLNAIADSAKQSKISIGCQNFYPAEEGAFTGEITLSQLPENIDYVLVGHSERRNVFGEDNELIYKKMQFAKNKNYKIVLCIGENLQIKNNGETLQFLFSQLDSALNRIDLNDIVIAYEPIWAIGSGQTPTGDEVELITKSIYKKYALPILYGGSVNEINIREFTKQEHIQGVLVGGASLYADKFNKIIDNA